MRAFVFLIFLYLTIGDKVSTANENVRDFKGYQVLSVSVNTLKHLEILTNLTKNNDLDFWNGPRLPGTTDIMATNQEIDRLKELFALENLEYRMKIKNLGELIEQERALNGKARMTAEMSWDAYHPWETVESWIQSLNASPVATVTVLGSSSENRPLYLVKVSTGSGGLSGSPKKAIFLEANIHANEWIAGATATYILNELITNYTTYKDILDEVEFYVIPMANPDGYSYTHTTDRTWRKTRSVNPGSECIGCDPNRNFGFQWGGEDTSPDPCSNTYHGPAAWSEPEVRAIRDAIKSIQVNGQPIQAYISLHSYGQVWLLSWGYTKGVYPDDYPELLDWGHSTLSKLQAVHGTIYTTGQGADIYYGVGGASDDYAKSVGIKYSTTCELRDEGEFGFLLPPEQIVPTGQETWAAVQQTARTIMDKKNSSCDENSAVSPSIEKSLFTILVIVVMTLNQF